MFEKLSLYIKAIRIREIGMMLVTVALLACKNDSSTPIPTESQTLNDFPCLMKQANESLTTATVNKNIFGNWQLYGKLTMLPTKQIPNLKLTILPLQGNKETLSIEIFENNLSKGKVTAKLSEIDALQQTFVQINSENISLPSDYYNFIRGTVRICEKELMIDNGMAFDAPAYLFRKI